MHNFMWVEDLHKYINLNQIVEVTPGLYKGGRISLTNGNEYLIAEDDFQCLKKLILADYNEEEEEKCKN